MKSSQVRLSKVVCTFAPIESTDLWYKLVVDSDLSCTAIRGQADLLAVVKGT